MKRLLLILAWTIGAYLGSAMVLRFFWGIIVFILAVFRSDWSVLGPWYSWTVKVVPTLFAAAFLFLAVFGRLPGTRTRPA
jgi:hypothetical protein